MEDLYERLIDMLGKSESDTCFDRFVRDLGETPVLLIDRKSLRHYEFPGAGLSVSIDKEQDQIKSVFLHLSTAGVEAGRIARYGGNLPAGIVPNDARATVRKKLALTPHSERIQGRTKDDPKDFWDNYYVGPLELTFIFDGGSKRMHALSVHYTIDTVPREPAPPEPDTYLQVRCTPTALKAIALGHDEARRLKHKFIGSEMLLLGVVAEGKSIAAIALGSAGVTIERAREEVEMIIGYGSSRVGKKIPYTHGAKRVLEMALKEAEKLGSEHMASGHLLLGLIECGEGVGSRVLENLYVDAQKLRNEVLMLVDRNKET